LEDVDGFLNFMVEPKKEVVNGTGNAAWSDMKSGSVRTVSPSQ
jgi:hypothetical protein